MGVVSNRLRFNASNRVYSFKTDWGLVERELHARIPQCRMLVGDSSLDIQTRYSSFMAVIESCIRSHTPSSKRGEMNVKFRTKSTPWWNEECERLARLRKAAFLKFKFLSSFDNFVKYKQSDAVAKRYFRARKREFFLEFCGSLNRTSNLKYVWHTVRSMYNKFYRSETSNVYNNGASLMAYKQN